MKILVTGAQGFVGARIMAGVKDAVAAPSLRGADEAFVRRMVEAVQPDVIIHTAAMSDIGSCERNPEGSWRANVEIPLWLAKTGVKLVAFSTDQVYSGCDEDGPYGEDCVKPANLYASHKLEMEEKTLAVNPQTVLLRATWMYDMPMYGVANRGNFLVNMLRSQEIAFPYAQHRGITYVREIAGQISRAAQLPGGVYNYGSENSLTMQETALWLKAALQLPVIVKDAGPRHHLWMDCAKAKNNGIPFMNTVDGLKQCIADYSLNG